MREWVVHESGIGGIVRMVFVSGVHGVGKSYFCDILKKRLNISSHTASSLITERKKARFSTDKHVWHETKRFGGVLKRDYLAYYREREIAIAYQLGEITLYEKPKKLRDLGLDYVPQSFAYI